MHQSGSVLLTHLFFQLSIAVWSFSTPFVSLHLLISPNSGYSTFSKLIPLSVCTIVQVNHVFFYSLFPQSLVFFQFIVSTTATHKSPFSLLQMTAWYSITALDHSAISGVCTVICVILSLCMCLYLCALMLLWLFISKLE